MAWVLRLVEMETEDRARAIDVMEIRRPRGLHDLTNLGRIRATSCTMACGRRSGVDCNSCKRALSISLIWSLMKRKRAMSRCGSASVLGRDGLTL
jgi:hypothetical protein